MLATDPWKRHRNLKRAGIVVMVVYFSPVFALVWLDQIDKRSAIFVLWWFGWAVFLVVMLILWHEIRCPRCGKRYYAKGLGLYQMTRECLHCGLPKYAPVLNE